MVFPTYSMLVTLKAPAFYLYGVYVHVIKELQNVDFGIFLQPYSSEPSICALPW